MPTMCMPASHSSRTRSPPAATSGGGGGIAGSDSVSVRKALDKSAVVVVLASQFLSYVQDPQAVHTLTEKGLDAIWAA